MFARSASSSGALRSMLMARLRLGSVLVLRRARLDAEPAAGAVLDVDLERVANLREAARVDRRALAAGGARRRERPRS